VISLLFSLPNWYLSNITHPYITKAPLSRGLSDIHSHRAGGAFDDLHGLREVGGIEVDHLLLGYLLYLLLGESANLRGVRLAEPFSLPRALSIKLEAGSVL
jgi:hypothetical protein